MSCYEKYSDEVRNEQERIINEAIKRRNERMKHFTFKEYEVNAKSTCLPVSKRADYLTLGLVGEAGEVAEKMKKIIRDNAGMIEKIHKEDIKKELGDVLWYITNLADFLGFSLEDVAKLNNEKLLSRAKRGKLHGSGDNR